MSRGEAPRVLVLSGSSEAASATSRLAGEAARLLALADADVTLVSLADYEFPLFDAERSGRRPCVSARQLGTRLAAADLLLFVCREVDGSLAASLKNLLEWTGGIGRNPYRGLGVALAAADEKGCTDHGFSAARASLAALGAIVAETDLCLTMPETAQASLGDDAGEELAQFLSALRKIGARREA